MWTSPYVIIQFTYSYTWYHPNKVYYSHTLTTTLQKLIIIYINNIKDQEITLTKEIQSNVQYENHRTSTKKKNLSTSSVIKYVCKIKSLLKMSISLQIAHAAKDN